jgi:Heavy metal associated domain 2
MLEYAHFVPGRLRLKLSELRNHGKAAEAETDVRTIRGVKSAVANPITGSLTISFDNHEISISDLWDRLRAEGYVSGQCPALNTFGSVSMDGRGHERFGRFVLNALADAVMQHSAQALVRALF